MLFVHIAIVDRLSSNMWTHVEMGVYYYMYMYISSILFIFGIVLYTGSIPSV